MSYTFRSDAITGTQGINRNMESSLMSEWSEETRKKWPDLCKPCDKGNLLMVLTSSRVAIYPDGKYTGYYFGEALLPYEQFTKAGYKCLFISPTGQATPDDNSIAGDKAEKYAVQVWNDKSHPIHKALQKIYRPEDLNDAMLRTINGLYTAGGHGCVYDLPKATRLQNICARLYEGGGIVGMDCHGPCFLDNLTLSNGSKLVAGKKATGFSTSMEDKMIPGILNRWKAEGIKTVQECIETNGGLWQEPKDPMGEFVVMDQRLITGVNPASAKKLADEMILMLNKAMQLGGTMDYSKITGKADSLAGQQPGQLLQGMEMNKSAAGTSGTNELPAEFHRNPQPYEIDHPKTV